MKNTIKVRIVIIWAVVMLAIISFLYIPKYFGLRSAVNVSKIEKWSMVLDGEEKEIELPANLNKIADSKSVELYTVLPEAFAKNQTICFWTYYQDVEVYVDDMLLYTTGLQTKFGKATVSRWNYIDTPENMAGKTLRIKMSMPYDKYKYVLEKVVYGANREISAWLHTEYEFNQIIDYVLMISGVLFVLFAFIRKYELRYRMCYISLGMTSVLFGVWMRFSMRGIPVHGMNVLFNALIGHLAFFLIPIPLLIYLRYRVYRIKILVHICDAMLLISGISTAVIFCMQELGIKDVQENIFWGQMGLILCVSWAVFVAMLYFVRRRKSISILTVINAYLLVIAVLSEWINANTGKYIIHTNLIVHICTMTIVAFEFVMYYLYLKEKETASNRIKMDNKNLQLQVLTGQIRPHFILNTLGAIRSLIRQDANRASDLLYDFSKYIRKNMEQKDYSKLIPFLEELDYIDTYLKLETLRFDEKIQVKYDIKETAFRVLPLTIQPFVENAVKHGLLEKKQGGTLFISSRKKEDRYIIEIIDDGVGFDTKAFWETFDERKSVGMRSAIFRLENEMSAKVKVDSSTEGINAGTRIKIIIPE